MTQIFNNIPIELSFAHETEQHNHCNRPVVRQSDNIDLIGDSYLSICLPTSPSVCLSVCLCLCYPICLCKTPFSSASKRTYNLAC